MKGPKVLFTESIISQSKKKGVPAPGAYKTHELFGKSSRPPNKIDSSEEKFCGFIEQAKWKGAQTPFAQWDKNGQISYRQVDKSPRIAKIWA